MTDSPNGILSEMELDALQEIMNISFGSAAADLADIMDIFIHLSVPNIRAVNINALTQYIAEEISDFSHSNIVEQRYYGDFEGSAFLIFPSGDEKELISYFQHPGVQSFESDELIDLEKEVLMEIGNILIGACIGRIFELLNSSISYLPPQILPGDDFSSTFQNTILEDQDIAITMRTHFSFEDRHATGYLFLINSQRSIPHMKNALSKFLG